MLCKYKDILGKPKEGLHKYRFFGVAVVDVILTIIVALIISYFFIRMSLAFNAAPFSENYSNMDDNWTSKFYDENFMPEHIEIDRLTIIDEIENKNGKKISKNTYSILIIVSTNIAEASVTIHNLKFVIDSGFVNSNEFINNINTFKIKSIGEVNRI